MNKKIFIRSPYNYDVDEASIEDALECKDASLAQQHMKDECDINTILKNFGVTGELPMTSKVPTYGDFTGVNDYHSAMNVVAQANSAFAELPAELRARFDNDPAKFVEFFNDEKNREEAIALGLVEATEVAEASVTEADPSAPKEAA